MSYSHSAQAKRAVNGILLLNKPVGISSNGALQRAKQLYQARKAGHTGSLDQLASGLLPVCFGEATKISGFLLDASKQYAAVCRLGVVTTTADAEGEVVDTRPVPPLDRAAIEIVLQQFTGEIQQIPPMYSALKRQGQTLYKLARAGKTVAREPRPVTIYSIKLLAFTDTELELQVHCSKGTYIRTLAEDIGNALGCGAHISALHRTQVGEFTDMWRFAELESRAKVGMAELDAVLLAPHVALKHLPAVCLTITQAASIQHGQPTTLAVELAVGLVCLFVGSMAAHHFIGIGESMGGGVIKPKRLLKLDGQSE